MIGMGGQHAQEYTLVCARLTLLAFLFFGNIYQSLKNNAVLLPLFYLFGWVKFFGVCFWLVRWLSSLTARNEVSTGNVLKCVGSKTMTKNLWVGISSLSRQTPQ